MGGMICIHTYVYIYIHKHMFCITYVLIYSGIDKSTNDETCDRCSPTFQSAEQPKDEEFNLIRAIRRSV